MAPAPAALFLALPAGGQDATIRIIARPGAVEAGRFLNRTLGVEYTYPEGWVATVPEFPREPAKGFELMHAAPARGAGRDELRVVFYAVPLAHLPERQRDPHQFLMTHGLPARGPANAERTRTQLGTPTSLEIAGRPFERIDWRVTLEDGRVPADGFETQIAGAVNGEMLLLFLRGPSGAAVEELADTAGSLRFLPPEGEELEGPAAPPARPAAPVKRVAVSESALRARVRNKVEPVYPAEALNQNVQGDVLVQVLVGADGQVLEATVVSGHPLLTDAAVSAVKQWTFEPLRVDGAPAESETRLRISFRLKSARQAS